MEQSAKQIETMNAALCGLTSAERRHFAAVRDAAEMMRRRDHDEGFPKADKALALRILKVLAADGREKPYTLLLAKAAAFLASGKRASIFEGLTQAELNRSLALAGRDCMIGYLSGLIDTYGVDEGASAFWTDVEGGPYSARNGWDGQYLAFDKTPDEIMGNMILRHIDREQADREYDDWDRETFGSAIDERKKRAASRESTP